MVRTAFVAATLIYVILAAVVLKECVFLAPLRAAIWTNCGETLIVFSVILILNLFAGLYTLIRKLTLKETGDKLAHLEKQLRGSGTISRDLTERILERK